MPQRTAEMLLHPTAFLEKIRYCQVTYQMFSELFPVVGDMTGQGFTTIHTRKFPHSKQERPQDAKCGNSCCFIRVFVSGSYNN